MQIGPLDLVPDPGVVPLDDVAGLPGVADAVQRARAAVDLLRAERILRLRGPQVSTESARRGAYASAVLEAGPDGDPQRWADGAMRAMAGLGRLGPVWDRAPVQALARLHLLAGSGELPADTLGRPRTGPPAEDPQRLGAGRDPAQGAVRLQVLAAAVVRADRVPGVVLAAVVHGEVAWLRPFAAGNGVVARAAARLALSRSGMDPKGYAVPEVADRDDPAGYAAALAGYATGSAEGVAAWVVHVCGAVALGAQEGLAICEALERG